MQLSKYQLQLLKYLYRNPYLDYQQIEKIYSKSFHFQFRIPFFFFPKSKNLLRLKNNLEYFKDEKLIEYTPFKDEDSDTGQRYSKRAELHEYIHLRLTEKGLSIIEERKHNFLIFFIPYAITTAIAICALLSDILPLILLSQP